MELEEENRKKQELPTPRQVSGSKEECTISTFAPESSNSNDCAEITNVTEKKKSSEEDEEVEAENEDRRLIEAWIKVCGKNVYLTGIPSKFFSSLPSPNPLTG